MRDWYGRGRSLRAAIGACCLAAFLFFGFDQGVFSGILQNENWLDMFDHPVRRICPSQPLQRGMLFYGPVPKLRLIPTSPKPHSGRTKNQELNRGI
jgi:hypothetical protein